MQTTAQSILDGLQRAMLLRAESRLGQPRPMSLAVDAAGVPVVRFVRETLWQFGEEGDVMRVYRALPKAVNPNSKYDGAALRAIRAEKGVGRPPVVLLAGNSLGKTIAPVWTGEPTVIESKVDPVVLFGSYTQALANFSSQRTAAKVLGLNLSTFQRRLAKEKTA